MNGYADISSSIENNRNCLRRIARHDDQEFSNQSILNAMEKFVKTVNAMEETILVPCRLMDRKVGDSTDTTPVEQKQHLHHHIRKTGKASVRDSLNTSDLFKLYNMLNMVKVDLLWGRQDSEEASESSNTATSSSSSSSSSSSAMASEQQDKNSVRYKQKSASPAPVQQQPVTMISNSSEQSLAGSTSDTTGSSIKGHIRRPSTVSTASTNSVSTLSDCESEISAENDSGIESEGTVDQDKSTELAKQFRTHLLGLYRSLEQMTDAANYLTNRYQSDVGQV